MDPKKSDECCSILGVLPSVANKVGQIASELLRVDEDPKERKRERERARFTSMSEERRNELNKRRELYQRKKVGKNTVGSCTEVMDPRLHRNQRDRARPASMPSNKREEINRKRREYYQRKKEQPMLAEPNNGGKPSRNKENEDPTNYGEISPADVAYVLREKKCTYSQQWYKNMPPEKKKARKERERLYNATVERKEAKRASYIRRKEFRANTLHPYSIAMENPMYIPSP